MSETWPTGAPTNARTGLASERLDMIAVTVGRGQKKPQGELVELDENNPVASLGLLLSRHTGIETWWSGAIFNDHHRSNDRWVSQQVIGIDVDFHDALEQHAPLTEEARSALTAALPSAPCTWTHLTPRGARLVVLLDTPIIDRLVYPMAWSSLTAHLARWVPKIAVGCLRIDDTCRDLARYFWTPRATVGGFSRSSCATVGGELRVQ